RLRQNRSGADEHSVDFAGGPDRVGGAGAAECDLDAGDPALTEHLRDTASCFRPVEDDDRHDSAGSQRVDDCGGSLVGQASAPSGTGFATWTTLPRALGPYATPRAAVDRRRSLQQACRVPVRLAVAAAIRSTGDCCGQ